MPRKNKGHRQKGAGTVLKSRGAIEMHGVTIKEWERTPKKLLEEYCQKNNRARFRYFPAKKSKGGPLVAPKGKFCSTICIPDSKSKDKDLYFTPKQVFDEKVLAEHAACLLALFHFEPSRPHEKRLPEPYKSMWNSLYDGSKESTKNASLSNKGKEKKISGKSVSKKFSCTDCEKEFSKEFALATHRKREHPVEKKVEKALEDDAWDAAGKSKVAQPSCVSKLSLEPSGNKNIARSSNSSSINNTSTATSTTAETGFDLFGNSSTTTTNHTKRKQKRLELSAANKYASNLERKQASELKQIEIKNRRRKREMLELANAPIDVMMAERHRNFIEQVILLHNNNNKLQKKMTARSTTAGGDDKKLYENPEMILKSIQKLMNQDNLAKTIISQLKDMGFGSKYIYNAMLEITSSSVTSSRSVTSTSKSLEGALNWLCLNVPESDLPSGFDPRGKQLEVIHPQHEYLVKELSFYGFNRSDILTCVRTIEKRNNNSTDSNNTSTDELVMESLQVLYDKLVLCCSNQSATNDVTTITTTFASASSSSTDTSPIMEEMEILEAIYGDDITSEFKLSSYNEAIMKIQIKLQLDLNDGASKGGDGLASQEVYLQVYIPSGASYPKDIPIVLLKGTHIPLSNLLKINMNLIQFIHSPEMKEQLMIHDICEHLMQHASEIVHSTDPHPPSTLYFDPSNNDKVVSSATDLDKKKRKNNKKKKEKSHNRSVLSSADASTLSEALLKRASAKRSVDSPNAHSSEFLKMTAYRRLLPAHKYKKVVLEAVEKHSVVLIAGETGCGKSTQVPQFLLEEAIDVGKGGFVNLICTQPRRLAAVGVAERVASERCESIGDVIGYNIRGKSMSGTNTRLSFCTTGVLLRRLQGGKSALKGITHIIVDEVHERNIDTDFLLIILKRLLKRNSKLKVILMSATMNEETFVTYFGGSKRCPIVRIPGRTFPVTHKYLEDLLQQITYTPPKSKSKNNKKQNSEIDLNKIDLDMIRDGDSYSASSSEILSTWDERNIDYVFLSKVVMHIDTKFRSDSTSILVFLPGVGEIKRAIEALRSTASDMNALSGLWILPLHGALPPDEQRKVFQRPQYNGVRKVVLSTNIAETSITIDDIGFVIDTCKVKEMRYDPVNRMPALLETFVSIAAAKQRAGRAGRVRSGYAFRLVSKKQYKRLPEQQTPEMQRVPLEQICLQVKLLNLGGNVRSFLNEAMEPPSDTSILSALQLLYDISAVELCNDYLHNKHTSSGEEAGHIVSIDSVDHINLTPLGHHLAQLPMHVRMGKILLYGALLSCLDPIVTIVAAMSERSPFRATVENRELCATMKKKLSQSTKSDHIVLLKAYDGWEAARNKRKYCNEHSLSYQSMMDIASRRKDFVKSLRQTGFIPSAYYNSSNNNNNNNNSSSSSSKINFDKLNVNSSSVNIIRAALSAGMYPNILNIRKPIAKYQQVGTGAFKTSDEAKTLSFYLKHRNRVYLHPSSVNFSEGGYDSPWIVYNEIVNTSKVFVRDCSMVRPYALLLFGGKITVQHAEGNILIDDWIKFTAPARIGVLVMKLRELLDKLLVEKIEEPDSDILGNPVLEAMTRLLLQDGR